MIDTKRKVRFPDDYDVQGCVIGRPFPNMPDVLSLVSAVIDCGAVRVVRQNGKLGNSKGHRVSENIVMFGDAKDATRYIDQIAPILRDYEAVKYGDVYTLIHRMS